MVAEIKLAVIGAVSGFAAFAGDLASGIGDIEAIPGWVEKLGVIGLLSVAVWYQTKRINDVQKKLEKTEDKLEDCEIDRRELRHAVRDLQARNSVEQISAEPKRSRKRKLKDETVPRETRKKGSVSAKLYSLRTKGGQPNV